ncbi:MAG: Na(+)-translocating NADH-quinone reductase subunit C [Acidobacteriota bacterium]
MATDTIKKTIGVALGVCLVSSILVSLAFVQLKPIQDKNAELDKLKNILEAGGLKTDGKTDIRKLYKDRIEPVIIELKTGDIVTELSEEIKPDNFDIETLAKDPKFSSKIPADKDMADIKRRPDYMIVYNVKNSDSTGSIEKRIFPMYGRGLWSTMYGLLALDKDMSTIRGFTFYKHEETPGLGGEVDNPRWKGLWKDKVAFHLTGDKTDLKIEVIKGIVEKGKPGSESKIDGLSGSTLTTRGINNLVRFWLGFDGKEWGTTGYGPYIKKLISNLKEMGNE